MTSTLLDQLLLIGDLFQRDMAREFEGTGLTPSRTHVLWALQHLGPSTQQTLAVEMGVSARHVSGLVDALEAAEYVRRTAHPSDRRSVIVELTPSAEERMRAMQRDHARLARTLREAVAPDDRDAVDRGVAAIAERLACLVEEASRTEGGGRR